MTDITPAGFRTAGIAAGIKSTGAQDLALIVNDGPSPSSAAVFTPNRFAAAPVQWSRAALAYARKLGSVAKAVVLNSGGANACTGPEGFADTEHTAQRVADELGITQERVLVCSTGLIGERLPMDKVLDGISTAVPQLSPEAWTNAATAIITTDTHPKTATVSRHCDPGGTSCKCGDLAAVLDPDQALAGGITISGMAKGAGMLAPGLATMLVVLATDAVLDDEIAQRSLEEAVAHSFNRIDSDGCMSTNDTVILLGSGASGISVLRSKAAPSPSLQAEGVAVPSGADLSPSLRAEGVAIQPQEQTAETISETSFTEALTTVCQDLALQLIGDAEGASHDIKITVTNASSEEAGLEIARAVARSNLFKTAIFGNDPNWGRILSAAGTVPYEVAPFDQFNVDVSINGIQVCRASGVGEPRELVDLSPRAVDIVIDLHAGDSSVSLYTNDLTYDYVKENAE
jgi:glutamate N-acetyltransferase/amino-acid N-acetyltransferase